MPVRRIALAGADRTALTTEVVAALRQGRLCVLPTETVYGLAVLPSVATGVAAARALKVRHAEHEFTWHLARAADAEALAQVDDVRVQRLAARYWPGPLTLVLPSRRGLTVGLRVPAHEFTRAVVAAAGEPLWLTSVNRSGEPPLCDADAIERAFGAQLAVLVDDGPSPLGTASTVLRCTGPALEVLREGILARADVLHTAAAHVLFVCTGNTCRSPLAEVMARAAMAQALGIAAGDLAAHGLMFASAGTGTLDGMPASDGSLLVARERGLDLTDHRSTALTRALCARAARIYCLSSSHEAAVLELAPEASDRTSLLRPDGKGIADPYGGPLELYRRAGAEIAAAIDARLAEWRELLPRR